MPLPEVPAKIHLAEEGAFPEGSNLYLSTKVSRSFLKQIWLFTGQHEAFQKLPLT